MNTRYSKVISLLLALIMLFSTVSATTAFAASDYYNKLGATNASVTLDGTNDGEVTVSLVGTADMDVYAIQGDWDTKETEGTNKLKLDKITTDVTNVVFTGMNYADAPTGKVLWTDDTFSAPAKVANGTKLLNATYKVAADTPSGTYTVRFKFITLTATDYNSYTDEVYYTAKITVTNNGGGGSTGSYYDKLEAKNASVALDGTNDGEVTVSLVGNSDMDVYAIQGDWDTKETEGTNKLKLDKITTDVTNVVFTGMNYADAPTGKVLWTDDTFSAPAKVANGTKLLNATYKVAADTPAGTYTVRFKFITLTATDYNSYTDEVYYTAKITVTRPAAHVCSGTFTKGQAATCTVDGWKDYYTCSCGKNYSDSACTNVISDLDAWKKGDGKIAASHDYGTLVDEDPGKHTATEVKDGMKAHYFCDTCDTYFDSSKNPTTKAALTIVNAHSYDTQYGYKEIDGHADTCSCGAHNTVVGHTANIPAPTEDDDQVCKYCGFVIATKTGHIHQNNLTPVSKLGATCTDDGYKAHYKCSCGLYFEDASASVEITDIDAWKAGAGKIAAEGHKYTEQKKDTAHLKTEATNCTEFDVYWYDCSVCDANAKNDPNATDKFWTSTDAGEHKFDEKLTDAAHLVAGTGANCQDAKKYYYDCAYCATMGTTTWTSTTYGDHSFTEKLADAAHLVAGTGANCQDVKEYYYDCAHCAEIGTTTWASTEVGDHEFDTTQWGYKDKATGHAHKCKFCNEHDAVQPHTPNMEAPTETEDKICTACQIVLETATGHICKSHLTKVPANGASCTVNGNIEYYECSCGKYYTDSTAAVEITDKNSVVVEAGHNYGTLIPEEPAKHTATELKAGMKAHYFCDKCSTYFTAEKVATTESDLVIPAPVHEYNTVNGYKEADGHADTCSCGAHNTVVPHTPDREAATETDPIKCSVCGYEITPALGHTCKNNLTKVAAEPATCTKDGNIEYYTCSCGKWYTDATASVEITDKDSVVIKAGHNYGTEWKSDKDNHWNECACGDKANSAAHKDENKDGKCDVCQYNVGTPGGSTDDDKPSDNPQTGDNSNMILWISLLMISALGVVATTIIGKRKYSVK